MLPSLVLLQMKGVNQSFSKPSVIKKIDILCETLSEIESMTKARKRDDLTLANVRHYLDTVVEDFSFLSNLLYTAAKIVKDLIFESAIVNLESGKGSQISKHENISARIVKSGTEIVPIGSSSFYLADRA